MRKPLETAKPEIQGFKFVCLHCQEACIPEFEDLFIYLFHLSYKNQNPVYIYLGILDWPLTEFNLNGKINQFEIKKEVVVKGKAFLCPCNDSRAGRGINIAPVCPSVHHTLG